MQKPWMFLSCLLACANLGVASEPVRLTAAGSTFIHPILSKWATEYRRLHPNVEIYYEPTGSGKGIIRSLAGIVDFGASDGPATDQQLEHAKVKILHFPVTLGAVVPAYNLPGVQEEIRFTGPALAGIFMGKVKRWNDPILAIANPNVHLPDKDIYVVCRSDSSGTTYVWTDYLSKVSQEWNKQMGRGTQVFFPTGNGTQFNEGVAAMIKTNLYSLGYLQTTYAIGNPHRFWKGGEFQGSLREGQRREYHGCRRIHRYGHAGRFSNFDYKCGRCRCLSDFELYLATCSP